MISIIIPTLNEERFLPSLLESIKKQNFRDYEIIVADAGSEDRTREIAAFYGCRIVEGGLPAKGRNEGAKIAKGEILFFLDADTLLPQNDFLNNAIAEFQGRKLDVATFCLIPFPLKRKSSLLFNLFYNNIILASEKFLPHAATGILVKREIFEKIGGFDEEIKLAEDHSFVRLATRKFSARFGIIKSHRLFVSDRRFTTDGWVKTGFKFLLCELHLILVGPVKSDIFKYRFNHYKKGRPPFLEI